MTSLTSRPDACCPEFAAVSRRGLLLRRARARRRHHRVGSAAVTDLGRRAAPGARPSWSCSRCAAPPTGCRWSCRTATRSTTRPGRASPSRRPAARQGRACSGCTRELAPLLPLWSAGKLAAVHATGLPAPNRSHFAAMEEVEDADPGSTARGGWLNRLVGTDAGRSPLQGFDMAAASRRPRSTARSR